MRRSNLNLSNLESDYGLGFRFNTDSGIVVRMDAAFGSRDGKHLWIVFRRHILGKRRATGGRSRTIAIAGAVALLATIGVMTTDGPRFYPDDPLWIDDDGTLDASSVVAIEDANSYDFVGEHLR